ncbi:hypothetical protein ACOSP7_007784 [Xanthoceras sorbifolium]
MKMVTMASHEEEEGPNNAYAPVITAITIAPIAHSDRNVSSDMIKWIKTAETERTMAMAFVTTNA